MATIPNDDLADFDVETLAGSADEIRERLKGVHADQIVALKLEHTSKGTALALAEAVRLIAPMIVRKLADRQASTLEKLVDALVPSVPLPDHLLTQARMNAEARKAVFEAGEWISAADLSRAAGFSGKNGSTQPNKWKREGRIYALRKGTSDFYPGYALDPEAGFRPLPGLAPVLTVFADALDPWDIAIWFASTNSFLGGARPMDLLSRAPSRVLAAAKDEVAGVEHG
ncbi:hypothetical protein HT136_03095 [Novosphingobium profundi]|uniref:hypothetical protein n=1 Tax=Novosphingobium profundi TaxID=1774954 RepID=UPI001BDB44E7|nr:hypothetical protein [Novosphingobium profundi]MBT0667353.1 hypothetical protein [Novosphingobium profundi]